MSPRNLIVSHGEQDLHGILTAIWSPYHILPKVAVKDVVNVDNRTLWTAEELDYMFRGAHFDFVIAEGSVLRPILAVEFDGFFHEESTQLRRDKLKDSICQKDGLRLLRYRRDGLPVFARNELGILRSFHELSTVSSPMQRNLLKQSFIMMFLVRCFYESDVWKAMRNFDIIIDQAGAVRIRVRDDSHQSGEQIPVLGVLKVIHDQSHAEFIQKLSALGIAVEVSEIPSFQTSEISDPDFQVEDGEPVWPPPHFKQLYVPHKYGLGVMLSTETQKEDGSINLQSEAFGVALPQEDQPGFVSVYHRVDFFQPSMRNRFPGTTFTTGAGPRQYWPAVDLLAMGEDELIQVFSQARNSLNDILRTWAPLVRAIFEIGA
jgi:hypothetical protein